MRMGGGGGVGRGLWQAKYNKYNSFYGMGVGTGGWRRVVKIANVSKPIVEIPSMFT